MWVQANFFKYTTGIILVLMIIYLILQISPILNTIFEFITTLLLPLVFAGILYYILRPLRDFLENNKFTRIYSIGFIFLFLIVLISIATLYLVPFFAEQITELSKIPSWKIEEVQNKTLDLFNNFNLFETSPEDRKKILYNFFQYLIAWLTGDVFTIIGKITKITTVIIFTPIVLFYLLKDSAFFHKNTLVITPKKYRSFIETLLMDMDATLSAFISRQFLVAIIIGCLMFIGYTVIGLQYAFLLALFALVFNMIPFIGTIISTIPAILVGFATNSWMGLKVVLVVIIVHALDANLITPNVLGQRLHIHPLTIILLLIACGSLYGVVGLLLATPVYALVKVIVLDFFEEKPIK